MQQNYTANNLNCFGIIQFLRCQMNKHTMKLHADSLVITVICPSRLKYNLIFAYFHIVRKITSTVWIRLCTSNRIKTTSVHWSAFSTWTHRKHHKRVDVWYSIHNGKFSQENLGDCRVWHLYWPANLFQDRVACESHRAHGNITKCVEKIENYILKQG